MTSGSKCWLLATFLSAFPACSSAPQSVGGAAAGAAGSSAGAAGAGAPSSGAGTGAGAATGEGCVADATPAGVAWADINRQPPAFYATPAAFAVADNVVYYQNASGGWPKSIDMTTRTAPREQRSTIDNSATTTQLVFLANVISTGGCARFENAFYAGLDYLFESQYDNGGWPQVYPIDSDGYSRHITFNDDAMLHVLQVLRDIAARRDPAKAVARYAFIDDARVERAAAAFDQGVECILAAQIVGANGEKTGWCAQHDAITLAPADARAYELASTSGSEGANLLKFLMSLEEPSQAVIESVQAATAWFDRVQLTGIRTEAFVDPDTGMEDLRVVEDPSAGPIWARFYELDTDVPIFCGRDGIKKYSMAEIEWERRNNYSWYVTTPNSTLSLYPSWRTTKCPACDDVLAP